MFEFGMMKLRSLNSYFALRGLSNCSVILFLLILQWSLSVWEFVLSLGEKEQRGQLVTILHWRSMLVLSSSAKVAEGSIANIMLDVRFLGLLRSLLDLLFGLAVAAAARRLFAKLPPRTIALDTRGDAASCAGSGSRNGNIVLDRFRHFVVLVGWHLIVGLFVALGFFVLGKLGFVRRL